MIVVDMLTICCVLMYLKVTLFRLYSVIGKVSEIGNHY